MSLCSRFQRRLEISECQLERREDELPSSDAQDGQETQPGSFDASLAVSPPQ